MGKSKEDEERAAANEAKRKREELLSRPPNRPLPELKRKSEAAPPLPDLPPEVQKFEEPPPLPELPAEQEKRKSRVPSAFLTMATMQIPVPPPRPPVPPSSASAAASEPAAVPSPPVAPAPIQAGQDLSAFSQFKSNDDPPKQLFTDGNLQEGSFNDDHQRNITVKKNKAGRMSIHSDIKTLANLAEAMGHDAKNPVVFTHLNDNPKDKIKAIEAMIDKGISVRVPPGELDKIRNEPRFKEVMAKAAEQNLTIAVVEAPQPPARSTPAPR